MQILQVNSVGEDVKILQEALNKSLKIDLKVDGHFGLITRNAVVKFQLQNGLVADGVAGFNTFNVLGISKDVSPDWLVIHCSATPTRIAGFNAQSILNYHKNILRWGRCGYARIVELDGRIVETHQVDTTDGIQPFEMTYGVGNFGKGKGVDMNALNVCYIGGVDSDMKPKDTRTDMQKLSLEKVCKDIVKLHKNIKIAGHNQFQNKACPSFWTPNWLKEIGVPTKNIYKEDPFGYGKILI